MRIPFHQMQEVLFHLFIKTGFNEENARLLAKVFTESTLMGVNSHGIDRVPLFVEQIEKGIIDINAEAERDGAFGVIERWDGNLGPGIINATKCTDRAIELSKTHGMGLVALRNTNHWLRGGSYGYQAAEAGCMSILFTNTKPNMPPWGGKYSRIGNNPFVVSIPRSEGHILLDMALSQFSFGKINSYRIRGEQLPFHGGWDNENKLSRNPDKILTRERGLPIGYWKGSAFSIVLDMLATILSAGDSTYRIGLKEMETGISQVFLCIYPGIFNDNELQQKLIDEIIDYTHDVEAMHPGGKTYYPGEKSSMTRTRNLEEGIPVDDEVWERVKKISS